MDDTLRRAERDAALGDPEARERWIHYCARMGLHFRNHEREEELTEWEEIQADYDEIWWHRRPVKSLMWTGYCRCCCDYNQWAKKLVKPKDQSWKSNLGDDNAKRKTLRTHRDGRTRKHRRRSRRQRREPESPHERRRKKRYGGKQHRKRSFERNPVSGIWHVYWTINEPNLDE